MLIERQHRVADEAGGAFDPGAQQGRDGVHQVHGGELVALDLCGDQRADEVVPGFEPACLDRLLGVVDHRPTCFVP